MLSGHHITIETQLNLVYTTPGFLTGLIHNKLYFLFAQCEEYSIPTKYAHLETFLVISANPDHPLANTLFRLKKPHIQTKENIVQFS